jgi:Asp-tRNA(Asn)/Glu-tRNA(Gln) amidotransferase C subunit
MAARRTILCGRSLLGARSCYRTRSLLPLRPSLRRNESTQIPISNGINPDELEQLLATPTWSVESLLPPKTQPPDAPKITSEQLHHLLRLSALPPPETNEQEQKMLDTLAAQLHFVGKIQEVDTTGVEPLRAIRDETVGAEEEQTITLATHSRANRLSVHTTSAFSEIRRPLTRRTPKTGMSSAQQRGKLESTSSWTASDHRSDTVNILAITCHRDGSLETEVCYCTAI